MPTPEWRKKTLRGRRRWEHDRLWKPGDSLQLAIGQKDLTVTPLQMTQFYAMLANNGRFVRPHLLQQVEQPGSRRTGADRPAPLLGAAARESRIDPQALSVVQQGLYEATHGGTRHGDRRLRRLPDRDRRQDGHRREGAPGARPVQILDQSWFCGYGPASTGEVPTIALCVVIENGGFGAEAAAPAALKIFQEYFHQKGGNAQATEHHD